MTEYLGYELVYLLLFLYLGFEGFKDLFIRFGEKHLQLKDKLKNQKDNNYFVYKIKTLFLPIIYSFKSTKVITIVIFGVVHNFFILEILDKAGYEVTLFNSLSNIGMISAAVFAAIISYLKSLNTNCTAKKYSEERLIIKSDYRKLYFEFLDLEIPNFIQILGVISLLGFLFDNLYFSVLAILIASFLFNRYLLARFFEFVKAQICDPYSELNRLKIDDDKFSNHYRKLLPLTSLSFLLLAFLIAFGITL